MRLLINVAHWRLVVDLAPQCEDDDDDDDELPYAQRLDANVAFGFSPDPVFPELEWEEEEEDANTNPSN